MNVNVIDVIGIVLNIESEPWQVKIDNRPMDQIKSFRSEYYWPWTSRNKKIVGNTHGFYSVEIKVKLKNKVASFTPRFLLTLHC